MTELRCSACLVILDTDHGYRDDQGRVLCVPCYWRAVSA